jgi:hypothetical protein
MRFRKLRIAWSVVWGVVAMLLIVLWVRSYWWMDAVGDATSAANYGCLSVDGGLLLSKNTDALGSGWIFQTAPTASNGLADIPAKSLMGVKYISVGETELYFAPDWFLVCRSWPLPSLPGSAICGRDRVSTLCSSPRRWLGLCCG